jgi:hypothetical protein
MSKQHQATILAFKFVGRELEIHTIEWQLGLEIQPENYRLIFGKPKEGHGVFIRNQTHMSGETDSTEYEAGKCQIASFNFDDGDMATRQHLQR